MPSCEHAENQLVPFINFSSMSDQPPSRPLRAREDGRRRRARGAPLRSNHPKPRRAPPPPPLGTAKPAGSSMSTTRSTVTLRHAAHLVEGGPGPRRSALVAMSRSICFRAIFHCPSAERLRDLPLPAGSSDEAMKSSTCGGWGGRCFRSSRHHFTSHPELVSGSCLHANRRAAIGLMLKRVQHDEKGHGCGGWRRHIRPEAHRAPPMQPGSPTRLPPPRIPRTPSRPADAGQDPLRSARTV